MTLTILVFAAVYLGMATGTVPGTRLDRGGIALIGLTILLAAGVLTPERAAQLVDAPTLILLLALMIVSGQFAVAGFYDWAASHIAAAPVPPKRLLALTILIAGGLSAVLANDVVVFAMTPLLCAGLAKRGLDPRPFLIGLASASNAGSAATLIGNPQNILIGEAGGLDFWRYLAIATPPALAALAITYGVLVLQWRGALAETPRDPPPRAIDTALDRRAVGLGGIAVVVLIALFLTPLPHAASGLIVAAAILIFGRQTPRRLLAEVDWPLLLLFACLFAVTGAFAATGLAGSWLDQARAAGFDPARLGPLAALSLVGSNTISNVPLVMLLLAIWPNPSADALTALALLSTLAGNFLLVGSLANIIVAERAATMGVALGFRTHARSGIPIALASMIMALGWLAGKSWLFP